MTDYYLLANPNPNAGDRGDGSYWGWPTMTATPTAIVVHTTESLADLDGPDSGAENVANWFATNNTPASYHTLVDSDSTVRCLPAGLDGTVAHTAFHSAGYNSRTLGVSFAMRADSWPIIPEPWATMILMRAADEVALWCARWGIPAVARTKTEVDNGATGVTGHGILDPGYRSDPGGAFPWPRFISMVQQRLTGGTPQEDNDDMAKLILTPGSPGTVWSTDGVFATRLNPASLAMLKRIGAVPATPEWGTPVTLEEAGDLLVATGSGSVLPLATVLKSMAAGGTL